MALTVRRSGQFKRDYKLMKRRGKDMEKLQRVMEKLASGVPLEAKYRDHPLVGNYVGRHDCHVDPDWLLIYKFESDAILFERTGTHADLFG